MLSRRDGGAGRGFGALGNFLNILSVISLWNWMGVCGRAGECNTGKNIQKERLRERKKKFNRAKKKKKKRGE